MAEPSEPINSRAGRRQKALIDQAAESLLDRRCFALSKAAFDRFMAMLDSPPKDNPGLRRLLRSQAPWER